MTDLLVNIRFYYWHFKLYKHKFWPKIEVNGYWYRHYRHYNPDQARESLFEVYQFFS